MILKYLLKYHLQDCINILSEKDNLGYFSIIIDFLKLFETYPDVGDKVLCTPIESLPSCNQAIIKAQQNILEQEEYKGFVSKLDYYYLKRNVHARFFGLPVCPELHRTIFPKNVDVGNFLKVTGTVVRVTQAKMLEYQRKYVCVKCRHEHSVEADFEKRYILKPPSRCGNEETRCKSYSFTQVNLVSREHCKDYQEIKIQEQVNKLSIGTIPGSMWVVLENDLVDRCKPGDDVHICGAVRRRWRPSVQTKKSEVELVLQANYLEVCNAQRSQGVATAPDVKECFNDYWSKFESCPLKGRDQILASVCPQVYGLHLVKLAVLLTLITGSDHIVESDERKPSDEEKHSSRVRGQCHLLLVGDPGTGKSQLLRAGVELSARSVFTSGATSSRAGLTCAALREDGEWQLEAGALVLSDGGVCCIDEIGQLRDHDRTAIHEAMEQQTISIAKAGIVCKLNTRCAIIAACNPKGHYATDQPLSTNVSLGTPLLSRFDLIFILLDSKNRAWDKLVSSYILFGGFSAADSKKQWSLEKLQMYIGLVGPRHTKMTESANIILQSYYMMQRKSEHRDPSRTTVRMLDSLVRLSQAHCRLMYRTTILPMDAVIAVSLVDLSMQDCTLNDTVNALHSTFHKYPDFDYICTAKKLLARLNLYEIWQNELLYYGKLLQVDHVTLEAEMERGNYQLFAKYDDVTDDNIPLSASLVTSSYFNNKKTDNQNKVDIHEKANLKDDHGDKIVIKYKLAATLKKRETLNKEEKRPPVPKKPVKRKQKEVTVDPLKKKSKRVKKSKVKNNNDGNTSDSDEEINDQGMLNAVPSVNDFFTELGIDLNFGNKGNQDFTESIQDGIELVSRHSTQMENRTEMSDKNKCEKDQSEDVSPTKTTDRLKKFKFVEKHDSRKEEKLKQPKSTTVIMGTSATDLNESFINQNSFERLKQFQFVEKHDLSKYEEKVEKAKSVSQNSTVRLETSKADSNNSSANPKSVQSSQLSIFESSDCDIDLDI